jgi:hypothetical protein
MKLTFYTNEECIGSRDLSLIPETVFYKEKQYEVVNKTYNFDTEQFEIYLEEKC